LEAVVLLTPASTAREKIWVKCRLVLSAAVERVALKEVLMLLVSALPRVRLTPRSA